MNKNVSILILIIALGISGYFLFQEVDHKNGNLNLDQKTCLDKSDVVLKNMNNLDPKLDYSLAKNNSTLEDVLGYNYKYVSYKNNNCYAVVQNYNPKINEYRYSVINLDTQVLEAVLLDHDLNNSDHKLGSQYREDFIEKYHFLFRNN